MDIKQEEIILRLKNLFLIPFYVLSAVYFVLYQPFLHYPEETFSAAFFKVLPILALIGFVRLNAGDEDIIHNPIPKSDFHKFTILGLLFSSIGDACLIARETMFIPGMLFFSIAQAWYMYALGPGNKGSRLARIHLLPGRNRYIPVLGVQHRWHFYEIFGAHLHRPDFHGGVACSFSIWAGTVVPRFPRVCWDTLVHILRFPDRDQQMEVLHPVHGVSSYDHILWWPAWNCARNIETLKAPVYQNKFSLFIAWRSYFNDNFIKII